jgi:hypothetical protein
MGEDEGRLVYPVTVLRLATASNVPARRRSTMIASSLDSQRHADNIAADPWSRFVRTEQFEERPVRDG